MPDDEDSEALDSRLEKWLGTEGYPLEYYTAGVFEAAGFDARQGEHVRSSDGNPREIDLVADMSRDWGDRLLRISTIVECKWSKDKPWVVFTSPRGRMAESACIAQTTGSNLGDALLWLLARSGEAQGLEVFHTPTEPGFGGRQAMTRGNDLFYASMAAVSAASVSLAADADSRERQPRLLPRYGLLCLPLIVIDGRLYEAGYDVQAGAMSTREVTQSRIHWKGAASWPLHATIDIVTRAGLPNYAKRRAKALTNLLSHLIVVGDRLHAAYSVRDWSKLGLGEYPTGRGGLPFLLQRFPRQPQRRRSMRSTGLLP